MTDLKDVPSKYWATEILHHLATALGMRSNSDPEELLEEALETIYRYRELSR